MTDPDERLINRAIAHVDDQDVREEARSALHRIFRSTRKLEAEVVRLRKERDHNELHGLEYKAENERLRNRPVYDDQIATMVQELEAEVERLRWSLKNADEDNAVLKAENERLRASAEGHAQCERNMDAEVEGLREKLDRERERSDLLHAQVLKFEKRIETGGWS